MKTTSRIQSETGARLRNGRKFIGRWFQVVQFDNRLATAIWWEGVSQTEARKQLREARAEFGNMPV